MCISKAELEEKVQEIRRYKQMVEEATNIQKALEAEVISYMKEHELEEEFTDTSKISYKMQERKSLDKKKLEECFGSLASYEKITQYGVLRIR